MKVSSRTSYVRSGTFPLISYYLPHSPIFKFPVKFKFVFMKAVYDNH